MTKSRKSKEGHIAKYPFPESLLIVCGNIFCIYIAFTIMQILFLDDGYNPAPLEAENISLIAFIAAVTIAMLLVISRGDKRAGTLSERKFYLVLIFCYGAIYVIQLFISPHIAVKSGWDVRVIFSNAEALAYGVRDGVDIYYFSTYPNNLLLVYTVALFLKLGLLLHGEGAYAVVLAILAAITCLSGMLTSFCVYKITDSRPAAIVSVAVAGLMVCLSPWMTIPYSDTIGLLFPISGVFCLLYIKPYWAKYFFFAFICFIGYLYKPTVVILFIAFMLVKLFKAAGKTIKREPDLKKWSKVLLSMLAALLCVAAINDGVKALNSSPMEEEKQMGLFHYLMMGLNRESGGMYSESDVAFSEHFDTREERSKANLQEVAYRLKEMGIKGTIELALRKNNYNYNDGTFGWGKEGNFYYEILPDSSRAAEFLRAIFFTNEMGQYNWIYSKIMQVVWMSILVSIIFCLNIPYKGDVYRILTLALLGLSIFLLIFECRARYLFLYVPIYILLASMGLANASKALRRLNTKEKKRENET